MKIKGIHTAPALVIVIMALSLGVQFVDLKTISENSDPLLTLTVLQLITIGIPAVFFCLLRGPLYARELRLRLIPTRCLTLTVYSLAFAVFLNMSLTLIMYKLFPSAFVTESSGYYASSAGGAIYAAICFAVVPAILEEFLFRGIIFAEYKVYGAFYGMIMSSVLFSMLHMSFVKMPIYFLTGIVLALTASTANSIFASMTVHIANNIFVLFLEPYIYKIAAKSGSGIMLLMFICVTLLIIFAMLFFAKAERLYGDRAYANEKAPLVRVKKDGEFPYMVQCLLAPTFIISAVFFIIASAVSA